MTNLKIRQSWTNPYFNDCRFLLVYCHGSTPMNAHVIQLPVSSPPERMRTARCKYL